MSSSGTSESPGKLRHTQKKSFTIPTTEMLNHLEGLLLTVLEPTRNRQSARWRKEALEFFQVFIEDDED